CGFAHVSRRERARFEQAVAAFDSAISIDEGFALAHYGRAHAYYLAMVEQWLPEPTAFPEFRRSASRAMELDPGSCGSQMMCGLALLFAGDLAAAYTHVREAVAINPSSCLALGLLGQLSLMRGQAQQAIAHLEEALRLGPRDPGAWLHYVTLAMAYFALRQPDAGAENCRHAITLRTDSALPRVTLIACLQEAGKEAECAAATRELLALHPEFRISAFLRLVRTAHPDDRQRLAAALAASGLSD
ncbi:MAG TPA: tetratricopeptide repeat protein, partial [Steroidobacteraceae bacterium]|nr:tetratricopeptide repeat protein [Steroidobacteraceae bacterium]